MAANADKFDGDKTISADQRWQSLLLATMNQERAELCEQGPLRTFFEMNAKFLMEIAS